MRRLRRVALALCVAWARAAAALESPRPTCDPNDVVTITVGPGPEDLDLDVQRSRLLISSAASRTDLDKCDGQIQALTLPLGTIAVSPQPLFTKLTLENRPAGQPFCPIGISLVDDGPDTLLYVVVTGVGHGRPDAIEKFRVEQDALVFQGAFRNPLLVRPNDVLALPGGEFYVSNANGHHGLAGIFEQAFKRRWANIAHYRAGRWSVAAGGIGFPNGLLLEAGGTRLRVAAFNERRLLTFKRDAEGRLERLDGSVELGAYPDNLMSDGTSVLAACHVDRKKTLAHIYNPLKAAPSIVYRVDSAGRRQAIFEDDGTRISASSTAVVHQGVLYVSQVARGSLAVCPLSQN